MSDPNRGADMTTPQLVPDVVSLRHGLRAVYISRELLAIQQRAAATTEGEK